MRTFFVILAIVVVSLSAWVCLRAKPGTEETKSPRIPLDPRVSRSAIGDLKSVPKMARPLFEPSELFSPLRAPGEFDWLSRHEEHGQTFDQFAAVQTRRKGGFRQIIYLLPIGEFGDESPSLDELRRFTSAYFQMPVQLLPVMTIEPRRLGIRRNRFTEEPQLRAPLLMDEVAVNLPQDGCCLLGVTMWDLYPDEDWNYVFGQASLTRRVGVFSFARFDPKFLDESRPDDWRHELLRRSCRVLAHETCHMFGMHHCIHYQCVVNGANNRDEMDRTPMHACPVCLRKLHWAIGFDPLTRERELESLYRELEFADEADWTARHRVVRLP